MRKRQPTALERFDALGLQYSSKTELAKSISARTGQSYRTVLRHFREGTETRQELQALKRREKYVNSERPREQAKRYLRAVERDDSKLPNGRKIARFNEESEKWGRGVVTSRDVLGINGLESSFLGDFARGIVHGEYEGFDLDSLSGRTFALNVRVTDAKTGEVNIYYHELKISNSTPADIWNIFHKHYKDGSQNSIDLI